MSWTLVETIEKSFPLDDPVSNEKATMIAGMVTGWFAGVITDMALEDDVRAEMWQIVLNNLGLPGTGVDA